MGSKKTRKTLKSTTGEGAKDGIGQERRLWPTLQSAQLGPESKEVPMASCAHGPLVHFGHGRSYSFSLVCFFGVNLKPDKGDDLPNFWIISHFVRKILSPKFLGLRYVRD